MECQINICFGLQSNDTEVCSGFGSCLAANECLCDSGYEGAGCELVNCFGRLSNDTGSCSSRGSCILPNTCACAEGFTGEECEFNICFGTPSNESAVCSSEGNCTQPGVCQCNSGFGGENCEHFVCFQMLANDSAVCETHGSCVEIDNCLCDQGYGGEQCELNFCGGILSNESITCNSHGNCTSPSVCECEFGYSGPLCELRNCFGVLSNESSTCQSHGMCSEPNVCLCDSGHAGPDCALNICGVLLSNNSSVCSGRGNCSAPSTCECEEGFAGLNCEWNVCFDTLSNESSVCSGKGLCTAPGVCECQEFYHGSNCSIPECFNIPANDSHACSAHGLCLSENSCSCDLFYDGEQCQHSYCFGVLSNSSNSCSAHGTCEMPQTCSCDDGYGGEICQYPVCFGLLANDSSVCSSNGSCVAPQNCNCTSGFVHSQCQTPICFGISGNDSSVCASHGICSAPDLCICETNFVGASCATPLCFGKNATDPWVCSGFGSCIDSDTCSCLSGYNGSNCHLAQCFSFLSNDTSQVCSGRGQCEAPNTCDCSEGYTGMECQINICFGLQSNDTEVCSGFGSCLAANECLCDSGYEGAGCELVNCFGRLSNDTGSCSSRGSCILPNTCACAEGFTGEECEFNICFGTPSNESAVCSSEGNCTQPGVCQCNSGFGGENCEHFVCFQMLANDSAVCETHGSCVEIDNCLCDQGYGGEQCELNFCGGILSNESITCNSHGNCTSPSVCECEFGYSGPLCELRNCFGVLSNESSTCQSHGMCSEPNVCLCDSGHAGPDCALNICGVLLSNNSSVCSGRGNCSAPSTCECEEGFAGLNCEWNVCFDTLSNESSVCTGHGDCIAHEHCECSEGYTGRQCELSNCFGYLSNDTTRACSAHGACTSWNHCNCSEGYYGISCANFSCFGVSHDNSSVCSASGDCHGYNVCVCTWPHAHGPNCDKCDDGWYGAHCEVPSRVRAVVTPPLQVIGQCDSLILDGTASHSLDGSPIILYEWSCLTCNPSDDLNNNSISSLLSSFTHPYFRSSLSLSPGEHKFSLRVHTATESSLPEIVTVQKYSSAIAVASIDGSSRKYLHASNSFDLIGSFTDNCGSAVVEFAEWTQLSGALISSWYTPLSTLHRGFDNALRFADGFPREDGEYTFQYEVKTLGIPHTSRVQVSLEVNMRDLVARLNDSNRSSIQFTPIFLSADASVDLEEAPGTDNFSLQCIVLDSGDACTSRISLISEKLWMFTPHVAGSWEITLSYSKGNRNSSYTIVYFVQPLLADVYSPIISINPVARVNLNQKVILQGILATNDPQSVDVTFLWSSPDMTLNDETLLSSVNSLVLVIRPNSLSKTVTRFKLTATHTNGRRAYATVEVSLNSPPISTSVNYKMIVSPSVGTVLDTQFSAAFSAWTDTDRPLSYRLFYVHPTTKEIRLLVPFTEDSQLSFQIPQPGCADNDFELTIIGSVRDYLGAETFVNRTIAVKPISLLGAKDWIDFALQYMPPDLTPPPIELWSFEPSLVKVVNNVAGMICANCSSSIIIASVCITAEDCLSNRLYDDHSYQQYQVRALNTLQQKLIRPTDDELVLVVDSIVCMTKTGNFTDEFLSKAPQFLWNMTAKNRIPLSSLPSMVRILSILTDAIFDQFEQDILKSAYDHILQTLSLVQQQYSTYHSPGERIDSISSTNFEFGASRGYSISYKELPKIRQLRYTMELENTKENMWVGSWAISPEPTGHAEPRGVIDAILTRFSKSPHFYDAQTQASLSDTYRYELRLDGVLIDNTISDRNKITLPVHGDAPRISTRKLDATNVLKCLLWNKEKEKWSQDECGFEVASGLGICKCATSTSDVAIFSVLQDGELVPQDNLSLYLVVLLFTIPTLLFCCFSSLCSCTVFVRKQKKRKLKQARISVIKRFRESAHSLAALNGVPLTEIEKVKQFHEDALRLLGDGLVEDAIMKLNRSADAGYTLSHIELGKLYISGTSINALPDVERAAQHFEKANVPVEDYFYMIPSVYSQNWEGLKKGFSESFLAVAKFYLSSGGHRDIPKGLQYLNLAIEKGSREACCIMAKFYREGFERDILPDTKKVVELYERASDLGEGSAMYNLSLIYSSDHFGMRDMELAIKWLKKAARVGVDVAKDRMQTLDFANELKKLKEKAEKDDSLAVVTLAKLYMRGKYVKCSSMDVSCLLEQDLHRAFVYLEQGARLGEPACKVQLGNMYRRGLYVDKDIDRALSLFEDALPHPVASYNLGLMYERGFPVYDFDKALTYFRNALTAGINQAHIAMDRVNSERFRILLLNRKLFRRFSVVKKHEKRTPAAIFLSPSNLPPHSLHESKSETDLCDHMQDMKLVASEVYMEDLPQSSPSNSQVCIMKSAVELLGKKDFTECFKKLQRVRVEEPVYKADSYFLLGVLHAHGKGVKKNDYHAFQYYRRAASLGHARASYECGKMLLAASSDDKKIKAAIQLIESAAKKGDVKSQAILSVLYWRGIKVSKDGEKARYYAELSHNKSSRSCNVLGEIYESVDQPQTAFGYYHRAARMGDLSGTKRCATLLCKLGRFDESIDILRKAKDMLCNNISQKDYSKIESDLQIRIEEIEKVRESRNPDLWNVIGDSGGEESPVDAATMLQKIFGDGEL